MMAFLQSRAQSFVHAFHGCLYVVRTQRNAWIHVTLTVIIVAISLWLRLDVQGWVAIVLVLAMVFIAEFLNTAIEVVVDLASPQQHPLAKVAKDVGAGAVLIAAVTAVVIGLLVLGPPLWRTVSPVFLPR